MGKSKKHTYTSRSKKISSIALFILLALAIPIGVYTVVNKKADTPANAGSVPYELLSKVKTNATASNTYRKNSANLAVDGKLNTAWNSGKRAPQSITLDLGKAQKVGFLDLTVGQFPSGKTVHEIYAADATGNFKLVKTISKKTTSGEKIPVNFFPALTNIKYIRITTKQSPSWVAWKDISVYANPRLSTNPNLKYFGYYTTLTNPDGTSTNISNTFAKYLSEINGLQNANLVTSRWQTSYLKEVRRHGLKALVILPGTAITYDQFLPQWEKIKKSWTAEDTKTIHAFYYDEPFWKGSDPMEFEKITGKIKTDFPGKSIFVVVNWNSFKDGKMNPGSKYVTNGLKYVSDIAVDYYYARDNTTWETFKGYYTKMKNISGSRRIWLIPDGYAKDRAGIERVKKSFDNYLKLANEDSQIVGIMFFVYTEHPTFPVNLRDVMTIGDPYYDEGYKLKQVQLGKEIIR